MSSVHGTLTDSSLSHHHQSLNREGRWGTTDDFATSFLHFSLFSTALWDLPNSRPVQDYRKRLLNYVNIQWTHKCVPVNVTYALKFENANGWGRDGGGGGVGVGVGWGSSRLRHQTAQVWNRSPPLCAPSYTNIMASTTKASTNTAS